MTEDEQLNAIAYEASKMIISRVKEIDSIFTKEFLFLSAVGRLQKMAEGVFFYNCKDNP